MSVAALCALCALANGGADGELQGPAEALSVARVGGGEQAAAHRRRAQDTAAEAAVLAAAPAVVTVAGLTCPSHEPLNAARFELASELHNGKAMWTATLPGGEVWYLCWKPPHYWTFQHDLDDGNSPAGMSSGAPIPPLHGPPQWQECCAEDDTSCGEWMHPPGMPMVHVDATITPEFSFDSCVALARSALGDADCVAARENPQPGDSICPAACAPEWTIGNANSVQEQCADQTDALDSVVPGGSSEAFVVACADSQHQAFVATHPDYAALTAFRDGQPPILTAAGHCMANWGGTDFCRWKGVVCNGPRVAYLGFSVREGYAVPGALSSCGLADELPDLAGLSELQALDLSANRISGIGDSLHGLAQLTSVNLKDNKISSLPPSACELGQLVVSGNHLNSLPKCFCDSESIDSIWLSGKLLERQPDCIPTGITDLSLQWDHLTEVPAAVFECKELVRLDLSHNKLTNLTASFVELKHLQDLLLTDNRLQTLPDFICDITGLVTLKLDVNRLTGLPASIAGLTRLDSLVLDDNALGTLPEEIGELKSLRILQADRAGLSRLPDSLGGCSGLVNLYADDNGLQTLPGSLGSLANLQLLRASNNSISSLPNVFASLGNLTTLELRRNELSVLPDSVGELPQLRALEVSYNRLSEFPTMYHADQLRYLRASHNNFTELDPKHVRGLTGLLELHMQHNQLSALPETLGTSCEALTGLWMGNNLLSTLPDSMAGLSLERLDVQNNKLEALPPWTGDMRTLKFLDATNNSITRLPSVGASMGHLYLYRNPVNADAEATVTMLNDAHGLNTFDLSISSASRYIDENIEGFNLCGTLDDPLRDSNGDLECVPRMDRPQSCALDEPCRFSVTFIDRFGVRSRIGGVTGLTVRPDNSTDEWNLADNRDGTYTAEIPAHTKRVTGPHRFRLFQDGHEFFAPQSLEDVKLCDSDDTPAYPNCLLELEYTAITCPAGAHPDAAHGNTCMCDDGLKTDGGLTTMPKTPAGWPDKSHPCDLKCDLRISRPSEDKTRCSCKVGFYDTSLVGLIVCFGDDFDEQTVETEEKMRDQALSEDALGGATCLPCPSCLECSEPGGVPTIKGTYRLNHTTHTKTLGSLHDPRDKFVFACPGQTQEKESGEGGTETRVEICPPLVLGSTFDDNMTCRSNHTGALCGSCLPNHTLDQSGVCTLCEGRDTLLWELVGTMILAAIVPLFFALAITTHFDEKIFNCLSEAYKKRVGRDIDVSEKAHVLKDIRHLSHFFETTKITISFGQVAALLPTVLGLPELNFHLPHLGIHLDIKGPLECLVERDGGVKDSRIFYYSWVLHVIGLPALMFVPVALFMTYTAIRQRVKGAAAEGSTEQLLGQRLKAHGFFVIFLIYPYVTEAIFGLFDCRSLADTRASIVNGSEIAERCKACDYEPRSPNTCDTAAPGNKPCPERWLVEDTRVACNGQLYYWYWRLAVVLVVLVAIGFPLFVWFSLWQQARQQRRAQEEADAGGNLFELYAEEGEEGDGEGVGAGDDGEGKRTSRSRSPSTQLHEQWISNAYTAHFTEQCYYWEPLDMVRKLILTGLITFMGKGTVSQLFVGILVTFFFFCLHISYHPYKQKEDNFLKACADLELFFVMLVTLVQKMDVETDTDRDSATRSTAFIGDKLRREDYDAMVLYSFVLLVVVAYIAVVAYKLLMLKWAVNYRARSKSKKFLRSSDYSADNLFDGMLRRSAGGGGSDLVSARESMPGWLEMSSQLSGLSADGGDGLTPTLTSPNPSPRRLPSASPRGRMSARERKRSEGLDAALGISPSPEPQEPQPEPEPEPDIAAARYSGLGNSWIAKSAAKAATAELES